MTSPIYHVAKELGVIEGQSTTSVKVVGLAYDHASQLLALSVIGAAIAVEAIHYDIQGQDKQIVVVPGVGERTWFRRYINNTKRHFTVVKQPIRDSTDIHMIMLADLLVTNPRMPLPQNVAKVYLWNDGEENLKRRVFDAIKKIVHIPVRREWTDYLYSRGQLTTSEERGQALLGFLTTYEENNRGWTTAGFNFAYMSTNKDMWTKLISDGLRDRSIFIE